MLAFVKSFATYRTIRMAAVISSALTLDSLSAENSTVTVVGTEIGQSDAGNWLVIDGGVYSITGKMVKTDKTTLSMSDNAINHTIKLTVRDGNSPSKLQSRLSATSSFSS